MNRYQKIFLAVAAAAALAACGDKNGETSTTTAASEQSAPVVEVQEVTMLGDKLSFKIPADLKLLMQQGGISVYMNDDGGITLAEGEPPAGLNLASLITQTKDNMKLKDSSAKFLDDGEFKIGDHVAKTFDVQMVSNGKDMHIVNALTLIDGRLVSIQILGAKNDAKKVAARAKAVFDAISLKTA